MAYLDENGLEYVLEKLAAEGKSKNADYATTAGSASSCTGNAATATKATSADSATTAGTCTGNAATATTATTANKVKGTLTIQGNGTTLTNGTYNGSANKTVNITPASIGAQVAGDYAAASHSHDAATNSASGFMTPAMVTKLNSIADNANNYSLPTASSNTLGGVKTTNTTTDVSSYTACPIVSGVPYYKDTNDKYTHPNSGVTAGTYNKVQVNAQGHVVSASNEYSFKSVKVGNVSVDADSSIDTLVLAAGDNITITPDATSDKITIAATNTTYSAISNDTIDSICVDPVIIAFVINGDSYSAQNGMTWTEWVDSNYASGHTVTFNVENDVVYCHMNGTDYPINGVGASDLIIEGKEYSLTTGGVGDW